jgi:hypothetical protein
VGLGLTIVGVMIPAHTSHTGSQVDAVAAAVNVEALAKG